MHSKRLILCLLISAIFAAACLGGWSWWRNAQMPDISRYEKIIAQLRPLHRELGPIQSGDWLETHEEDGQTFREYVAADPVTPTAQRNVLYILPLGEFDEKQRAIIDATAEYLGLCYNMAVKVQPEMPSEKIPRDARRVHPNWGMPQILSTYVLDDLLAPQLPDDAAAYICFTSSDLWPGPGWNFVFGQASLRKRVGVWSIYRNGDPHAGDEEFRTCLLRTLKTAAHETGHMFSIQHCIAYECCMCGSNHREESDGQPLAMCPECVAKIIYATGADPAKRFAALATFCAEQGLTEQAEFFQKSETAVQELTQVK